MDVIVDTGVRIVYVVLIVVVIFGAALVTIQAVKHLWKYVKPPAEISNVEVYWDGESDNAQSASFRHALLEWSNRPTGIAEDGSQVVSFAQASASRAQTALEQLDIKVGNVEINTAFAAFKSFFAPPSYELVAEGVGTSISVKLMLGRRQLNSWRFDGAPVDAGQSGEPTAATKAAARAQLLEDAVFRIMFDLWRGAGPGVFKQAETMTEFKSEKALEAYLRGTNYLLFYLRNREHGHLTRAIEQLRILRWEQPTFKEGLDLLALALAEDRRETEAIEIYDYLLGGVDPLNCDSLLDKTKSLDSRTALAQQEINRAAARFREYSAQSGVTAIEHLTVLAACLDKVVQQTDPKKTLEKAQWASLQAYAHAHMADVFGHFLTYLFPGDGSPGENADVPQTLLELPGDTTWDSAKWDDVRTAILDKHNESLRSARQFRDSAKSYWSVDSDNARHRSEYDGLNRLISSAKGYTIYLNARWQETAFEDNKPVRKAFVDACHQAIAALRDADNSQPNHYTVLQNLATVYSDPVFDPEGVHLDTAERLYDRSLTLTSNDYFGTQQVAELMGEKMRIATVQDDTLLTKALEHIEDALRFNPRSSTSHLLRARLEMWRDDPSSEQIERDIGRARELRASDQALQWVQIVKLVHKIPTLPEALDAPADFPPPENPDAKWDPEVEAKTKFDRIKLELTQLIETSLDEMGPPTLDGNIAEHEKFSALLEEVNKLTFENRKLLGRRF